MITEKKFKALTAAQQRAALYPQTGPILTEDQFFQLLNWYYESRSSAEFNDWCSFEEQNS